MDGEGRDAEGEPGWLAGLPVAIKDLDRCRRRAHDLWLADLQGSRARDARTPWWSASSARAASSSPSRTRRSSAPAAPRSTRCSDARAIPGTRRSPAAAPPAAAPRRWRPARCGWRTAPTTPAACAGPATYCSVVGLRPSAGRVTRGTANNLFAPLSVQGPMARTVADVALFLDAMAGLVPPRSPDLRGAAPVVRRVPSPIRRRRGESPSRRTSAARSRSTARRARSARTAARGSRNWAASSRRHRPDLGDDRRGVHGAALAALVVDRELHAADPPRPDQARHRLEHRARPEADAEPDRLAPSASAPPSSGAFAEFFETYDSSSRPEPRRRRST